jgi:hypothetical protein
MICNPEIHSAPLGSHSTVPSTVGGFETGASWKAAKPQQLCSLFESLRCLCGHCSCEPRYFGTKFFGIDSIMGDLSPYCCWLRFSQNMSQTIVGRVTWQGLVKSPRQTIAAYIYIAIRLISSQPIYTLPASKKRNTHVSYYSMYQCNKSIFFYWMVHDSLHDGTFWSGVNIPSHPVQRA